MGDFDKINKVYATYFPVHKPARICVEVAKLPKNALIEIDAIAIEWYSHQKYTSFHHQYNIFYCVVHISTIFIFPISEVNKFDS